MPTTGFAGCCARAVNGQTIAALPTAAINSRRPRATSIHLPTRGSWNNDISLQQNLLTFVQSVQGHLGFGSEVRLGSFSTEAANSAARSTSAPRKLTSGPYKK